MTKSKTSNSPLFAYLAIFYGSFLFLFLSMDMEINTHDEGIILTGAMRVAAGDIPHRDFYTNYGPAQFYILAFLFKIFGEGLVVERIYDLVIRSLVVLMCYVAVNQYFRKYAAFATAIIATLWLAYIGNYGQNSLMGILLPIASSLLILPVLIAGAPMRYAVIAGAITGFSALFRYDSGLFLYFGHIAAMVVSLIWQDGKWQKKIKAIIPVIIFYTIGTLLIFMPVALWYLAVASLADFVHDIITYSATQYAAMRYLPFPPIWPLRNFSIYIPLAAIALALLNFILGFRKGEKKNLETRNRLLSQNIFLLFFCVVTAVLYTKALVRTDIWHAVPALIPSLIVIAGLLDQSFRQKRMVIKNLAILIISFLFISTSSILVAPWTKKSAVSQQMLHRPSYSWCQPAFDLERITCFYMGSEEKVTRFLLRSTGLNERIFVGMIRHDRVLAGNSFLYFAAGRMPVTKWHQIDPGLHTTEAIQNQIIADLERLKTRYIVLDESWKDFWEPNQASVSSGVVLLDNYIKSHYQEVLLADKLHVMERIKESRKTYKNP